MNSAARHDLGIGTFLRRAADKDPEKTYLVFHNQRFSYCEFVENINRASRAFQELGVAKGDKVCLLVPVKPFISVK